MNDDFHVQAGEFEGPLDVLLHLIEKRKLHVSDVSLVSVTDSYMEYMKSLENEPYKDMADFVLVAATLMLIKSLALLPSLQVTPEEESSIHDLEERLRQYQKVKDHAVLLSRRFGDKTFLPRGEIKSREVVFAPSRDLSSENLKNALWGALSTIPKKESVPRAIISKVVSLEEVVSRLVSRVQENFSLRFNDFAADSKNRVELIVSFLAMLELVRRGALLANQSEHFGDIELQTGVPAVPRYGV